MNPQSNQSDENIDSSNVPLQSEPTPTQASESIFPEVTTSTEQSSVNNDQQVAPVESQPQDSAGTDPLPEPSTLGQQDIQGSVSPDPVDTGDVSQSASPTQTEDTMMANTTDESTPPSNPVLMGTANTTVNGGQSLPVDRNASQPSPFAPDASQGQKSSTGSGFAVAALVLGIIAVIPPTPVVPFVNILSIVLGILAITFGFMHLRKLKKAIVVSGKGMAIAGIITGAIAVIVSVFITGMVISTFSSLGTGSSPSFVEVSEYGDLDSGRS